VFAHFSASIVLVVYTAAALLVWVYYYSGAMHYHANKAMLYEARCSISMVWLRHSFCCCQLKIVPSAVVATACFASISLLQHLLAPFSYHHIAGVV
jgi:hypothetical protein